MNIYSPSKSSGAPLSGAIKSGGFLFVSGQIHADKDWNLIGNTIEEKFDTIMTNIKKILQEATLDLSNIIQVRLYLTDMNSLPKINELYTNYFDHPMPIRTAIGGQKPPSRCLFGDRGGCFNGRKKG